MTQDLISDMARFCATCAFVGLALYLVSLAVPFLEKRDG
jgi:hypothetical protein